MQARTAVAVMIVLFCGGHVASMIDQHDELVRKSDETIEAELVYKLHQLKDEHGYLLENELLCERFIRESCDGSIKRIVLESEPEIVKLFNAFVQDDAWLPRDLHVLMKLQVLFERINGTVEVWKQEQVRGQLVALFEKLQELLRKEKAICVNKTIQN